MRQNLVWAFQSFKFNLLELLLKNSKNQGALLHSVCHLGTAIEDENNIDSIVKKFWEQQQQCDDKFRNSIRYLASGWFIVPLPFKSDTKLLGSSFEVAKKQLLSQERRLFKDDKMGQIYHDSMKEYFYLRPQSTTTKLRAVFDASYRTSQLLLFKKNCILHLSVFGFICT